MKLEHKTVILHKNQKQFVNKIKNIFIKRYICNV